MVDVFYVLPFPVSFVLIALLSTPKFSLVAATGEESRVGAGLSLDASDLSGGRNISSRVVLAAGPY